MPWVNHTQARGLLSGMSFKLCSQTAASSLPITIPSLTVGFPQYGEVPGTAPPSMPHSASPPYSTTSQSSPGLFYHGKPPPGTFSNGSPSNIFTTLALQDRVSRGHESLAPFLEEGVKQGRDYSRVGDILSSPSGNINSGTTSSRGRDVLKSTIYHAGQVSKKCRNGLHAQMADSVDLH